MWPTTSLFFQISIIPYMKNLYNVLTFVIYNESHTFIIDTLYFLLGGMQVVLGNYVNTGFQFR